VLKWLFGLGSDGGNRGSGRITGTGEFAADVIGEGRHTADLTRIFASHAASAEECVVDADLMFEDEDPNKSNAVPVHIDGCWVGYLPRATAQACRKLFASAAGSEKSVKCTARIRREQAAGGTLKFEIRLDLPLDGTGSTEGRVGAR
jgi:hypothetical protein